MVRVAGLVGQVHAGHDRAFRGRLTPAEQLERDQPRRADPGRDAAVALARLARRTSPRPASPSSTAEDLSEAEMEWLQDHFLAACVSAADAAGGRSRAPVPVHSQSRLHPGARTRAIEDAAPMSALVRFPNRIERLHEAAGGAGTAPAVSSRWSRPSSPSAACCSRASKCLGKAVSGSFATATSRSRRRRKTLCGSTRAR